MYAYVDETGNTGKNLFDTAQPNFITGALITKKDFDIVYKDDITALARSVSLEGLHAKDMGIEKIDQVSKDLVRILRTAGSKFFISRVQKKYLLASKVFDTLFDSGENMAMPWHAYNYRPLRMLLCLKVAYILDDRIIKDFWDALMSTNIEAASAKLVSVCEGILNNVNYLPDQSSIKIISEALAWAKDNTENIYFHSESETARYGHLPNMVAFGNLLDGIENQSKRWDRAVVCIKHDRQMQFETSLKFWHDIFSQASPDPLYLPGGEKHVFRRVFGSKFQMSSSNDSAGIQVTDLILWIFKRTLQGEYIPKNAEKVMHFVYTHSWWHDFSFEGAEDRTHELLNDVLEKPFTSDDEARSKKLLSEIYERRDTAIESYRQKRAISAD